MTEILGRRERKKAQTRRTLADAALRLFLEKGFENVGVREVAEQADVSPSTLFQHFRSKEALVFDLDEELETELIDAVRDRAEGQSALGALREYIVAKRIAVSPDRRLAQLIDATPALSEYSRLMWTRHEDALAKVLAGESPEGPRVLAANALARFVLAVPDLARQSSDPIEASRSLFDLLERGFSEFAAS